jgi:NTP pyrophosphatase (non-canonical NTP hydrolase)
MPYSVSVRMALAEMTAEVREVNIEKGWRVPEGGPGDNSFGDYVALLTEELGEMTKAYRKYRLDDATAAPCNVVAGQCFVHGRAATCDRPKPEGVGSEMADVLIRLLDTADVFGIDLAAEYARKVAYNRTREFQHGGTMAGDETPVPDNPAAVLDALHEAMPTGSRHPWTIGEVRRFVKRWNRMRLPSLIGPGPERVGRRVFRCVDMRRAADMLEMSDLADDVGFTITRGEHSARIVQAEKE